MVGEDVGLPYVILPIDLTHYQLRVSKDLETLNPSCKSNFHSHDYSLVLCNVIGTVIHQGERVGCQIALG